MHWNVTSDRDSSASVERVYVNGTGEQQKQFFTVFIALAAFVVVCRLDSVVLLRNGRAHG